MLREPLTQEAIAERIKGIVLSVLRLDLPPSHIHNDTNLYELGLESLNVIDLLTELEGAFDITVDVEDLSADIFSSLAGVVAFVQRKIDEA